MPNSDDGWAMFLGRFQPLHEGHKQLFQQALDEGKKVCVMIRKTEIDEKNPFTPYQILENIHKEYSGYINDSKFMVMLVPNITSVNFGRGVGYDIIEYVPPVEVAEISATKIREQMKQQENKV